MRGGMSGCHPDATTKKIAGEQNKTNRGIPRGTEQSNKPSTERKKENGKDHNDKSLRCRKSVKRSWPRGWRRATVTTRSEAWQKGDTSVVIQTKPPNPSLIKEGLFCLSTFDFLLSTKNLRFCLHISKKSSNFARKIDLTQLSIRRHVLYTTHKDKL